MDFQTLEQIVKSKKVGAPRYIVREKRLKTLPGVTEVVVRRDENQCQVGTPYQNKQGTKDAVAAGIIPDHSDPTYQPRPTWWEWLDAPYFANYKGDKNRIYLVNYPINELNAKCTFFVDGVETDPQDVMNILCAEKDMYKKSSQRINDYNNQSTTAHRFIQPEFIPIQEIVEFR